MSPFHHQRKDSNPNPNPNQTSNTNTNTKMISTLQAKPVEPLLPSSIPPSPTTSTSTIIPETFQHSTHDSHSKGRSNLSLHPSTHSIASPSSSASGLKTPREPEAAGHGAGLRGRDDEMLPLPLSESSCDTINSNTTTNSNLDPSNPSSSTSSRMDEQQQINNLHLLAALAGPQPQSAMNELIKTPTTPMVPPESRKLCVRHQRMADEGITARLQKSIESLPLSDQTAVNTVWSLFSSSSHSRRALILQGLLTMCCFSQLSLLSSELALAIRIDPFSLLPREVCIRVLTHLDAITLGRAAQVSKIWKALADDDVLWRNMCEQHIERKCEKCGWGLPLLSERRRRVKGLGSKKGTVESRQLTVDTVKALKDHDSTSHPKASKLSSSPNFPGIDGNAEGSSNNPSSPASSGNLKRSITAAANAAALERQSRTANSSRAGSPARAREDDEEEEDDVNQPPSKRPCTSAAKSQSSSSTQQQVVKSSAPVSAPAPPAPQTLTRPWKTVYCERLAIERNWRRGRHTVRTLSGHKEGIMCLQYSDSLAHPSFPVVITGSYDRTARVWNLETGEELRVLRGHTRGVRCLRFDEAKLITGSMDRTLKIWNWRTGDLIRTLEGHTEGIVCLDFNDDTLASGSADAEIKVWNFRTGKCVTLRGHEDWVNAVQLWTGPGNKDKSKEKEKSPSGHNGATDWASSDLNSIEPDEYAAGTFLFSASDDGTIRLWDLGLRECLLVYDGHVGQVQSIKLLMLDEEAVRKLANGAAGGPGAEAADRKRSERMKADHHQDSTSYGSSSNPSHYVPRSGDGSSYFSYPDGTHSTPEISCGLNPSAVPGGRSANTSAPGIPEHFYDAAANGGFGPSRSSNKQEWEREQHRRRKIDPVLARVQERLCEAGLVDPLPIDAEMADLEGALYPQGTFDSLNGGGGNKDDENVRSPPINNKSGSHHPPKRPVLLSGSLDNTLKVWDVRTGRCLRTMFGHVEGVWALDVDKLRIASASHDRTIKIWDRETVLCQNTLVGHKGAVTCVALGDDKIVSGSDDGDCRVWNFALAGV